jgi:hypothetical protein
VTQEAGHRVDEDEGRRHAGGLARLGLDDLTFGVNWCLNANTRVLLDYILADLDPSGGGTDGDTNILSSWSSTTERSQSANEPGRSGPSPCS